VLYLVLLTGPGSSSPNPTRLEKGRWTVAGARAGVAEVRIPSAQAAKAQKAPNPMLTPVQPAVKPER
jgi:hypothetical protein